MAAGPGAYPAPTDAGVEVGLALLGGESLGAALDTDLALEALPPKGQAGPGVGGQVSGLAAGAEVAVDDEAVGVELLEVDDARRHATRGKRCRGQTAGLRVRDQARPLRRPEPAVELPDGRFRVQVMPRQDALGELLSLAPDLLTGRGNYG